MNCPFLRRAAIVIVSACLLYAGWQELTAPTTFAYAIAAYELIPLGLTPLFALTIPVVMILAGLSLLSSVFRVGGALAAGFLLTAFTGAIISAKMRGLDINCGCAAGIDLSIQKSFPLLILRNASLLAMLGMACVREVLKTQQQEIGRLLVGLAVASAVVTLAIAAFHPFPPETPRPANNILAGRPVGLAFSGQEINLRDAMRLPGKVSWIDVRADSLYQKGHIKGAISEPLDRLRASIPSLKSQGVGEGDIVVYCLPGCHNSSIGADILAGAGFGRLHVLQGGWEPAKQSP